MKCNLNTISTGCAKGLLLAQNIICITFAISMFCTAIVDSRVLKQYGEDKALGTFTGDVMVAATSLFLLIIAVFGCVGCLRENVKFLYLYVGLVLILVVVEIMVGIFQGVQRCGLHLRVSDWLRSDFFRNVTGEELDFHSRVWDELQTDYECCGLNGPEDYLAIQKPISMSCCPAAFRARTAVAQKQLYRSCIDRHSYSFNGCEDEILGELDDAASALLGIAFFSLWFEAAAVIFAMWIANNLKNSVKVYKHTIKY